MSAERPRLLTRTFALLTLANFTVSIAGAFQIHLSGFLRQLGAGEAQTGRIIAVAAGTAAVLGAFAGRALDHFGRRAVLRLGAVLITIDMALYLLIDRIGPALYALRVFEGAASTTMYAATFTFAAELVPAERRTQGIALFGASGMAPMAISAQLGDLILAHGSYRTMFATATAFCAVGGLLCWTLPEPARALAGGSKEHRGMLATAKQRDLLPIWPAALVFFSCMAAVLAFLKTFVLATGYGKVGTFFTVYVAVALTLRLFFGALPDRVGLRRMVLPAVGSYGLGALALAASSGQPSLLLAGALCGVGHGYGFPVLLSLVHSRAQPEARGTATGVYTAVDWAANLLAPPLLGALIEDAGYPTSFAVLGAIAFCGIALFYVLDRGALSSGPAA
jgi:MFS family permease